LEVETLRNPQGGVESVWQPLARLGTLLWVLAVALASAGTVGGIVVARIAHPVQAAPPGSPPSVLSNPSVTLGVGAPPGSTPAGVTHPYVTLGIAVVFVALVAAAAVAAVAWAMRHVDGARR
jgi:hypothetical protein